MSQKTNEELVENAFSKLQLGSVDDRRKRFSIYRKTKERGLSKKRAFWGEWNEFSRNANTISILLFVFVIIIAWIIDLGTGFVWERSSWDIWISRLALGLLGISIASAFLENISHTHWRRCYWNEHRYHEDYALPARLQQAKEQIEKALEAEGLAGCYDFWIQESRVAQCLVLYVRGNKEPIPIAVEVI